MPSTSLLRDSVVYYKRLIPLHALEKRHRVDKWHILDYKH